MKLGIIVDSSAGITKAEAEKKKWGFLPLYINIDGKDYADGIDLTPKTYYSKINLESEVRTSATPPALVLDLLEKMSKENDHVIVYALSTKLSSQTNNITMMAREFDNVFVVPSLGVGFAITRDLEEIEKKAKSGSSWEELQKEVVEMTNSLYGIAAPETMKWLVKGGRVSSSTASMANMLKIVPLIAFENGGLEKYGKGRVFKKAVVKFTKELYSNFNDDVEYIIYHSNNENIADHEKAIREVLGDNVKTTFFPSVIVNHIGPGAVAVIKRKKA